VLVTAIPPLALAVGVNRIVRGNAIPHPFGYPGDSLEEERARRRTLVERALAALSTPVDGPTVFDSETH
jgi:betaine reductase